MDESGVFPSGHYCYHGLTRYHISRGMNNRPAGVRSSETFHPIDVISQLTNTVIKIDFKCVSDINYLYMETGHISF
jgi:hypothetical protein